MTTWQWKVVMALVRIVYNIQGTLLSDPSEDMRILNEAINREKL